MYVDEVMELFVYRKLLKILFKVKDKTSNTVELAVFNSLIKQTKSEIDEVFIKANIRKTEKKKEVK